MVFLPFQVFSVVFGDGDPNQGIEEERWKLVIIEHWFQWSVTLGFYCIVLILSNRCSLFTYFRFMCKATDVELCLKYITDNDKGNGVDENLTGDMGLSLEQKAFYP